MTLCDVIDLARRTTSQFFIFVTTKIIRGNPKKETVLLQYRACVCDFVYVAIMIHDNDMDDDKNIDAMDIATEDATTTTTTTNAATHSKHHIPEPQNGDNDDDGNKLRKQQQQYQNLDTWLQLIETAIQPFQQQNQMLLKNITNCTRYSPQYIVQSGILSSNDKNYSTDVVGSAMVKTTSIPTNLSVVNTATTTETTTSTILIATVTLQVGQPSIVAPKQGDITVTLNYNNNNNSIIGVSASHSIQVIQSKIQRILDENIDLEQLHIIEGKLAYRLVVTITILFVEVITSITLFDACLLAASAALLNTKLHTHPIINDGILYSTPTSSSTTLDHGDHTDTPVASGTSGIVSNANKETKPLHMPVIPISFTALGVRLPISTVTNTLTSNETCKNPPKKFHWIGDPTIDEQQISDSMTVTVVMNAAAMTTMSKDDHREAEEEDDEEVLHLQVTPTTGTTRIDPSLTSTSTTALSWIDLDNVMSMARRHVKSLNKLIKPKIN